jgi:tRNA pseudouridine38-40 synthase
MYYYKSIVAYDGTDYQGWQSQPHQRTICDVLTKAFSHVFQQQISIVGSSRTDAGVHALGQVFRITTPLDINANDLMHAWNNRLPAAISIRSLTKTDKTFHPQVNVKQKIYWYHVSLERPLPFFARYIYRYRYPFTIERLHDALQLFVGTHDFRSFCSEDERDMTVRTIDAIEVEYVKRFKVYRITIKGPSFLRYMIRRIVGAALEVSSRRSYSLAILKEILERKNPEHALPNAPAHGLMLARIIFTPETIVGDKKSKSFP